MVDADFLNELIRNPREALAVEVKSWIDPQAAEGEAKIARCALAMRNHGGGFMVIGFDNDNLAPVITNRPADVRASFHADTIQGIVSRYASESFEVTVHFPERDGVEFPVIEIPASVRTPVASKTDLVRGGLSLVRKDAIYVRSLNANGIASTTVASWKDWSRLVETCFDNRDADIARFLRRHLAGADLRPLKEFINGVAAQDVPPEPTVTDRLTTVLNNGLQRFHERVDQEQVTLPEYGWWEIAAIVRGVPPIDRADLHFRDALLSSNPNLTGWPIWVDSRHFGDQRLRPYLADDETWETFICSLDEFPGKLDFWRLSSRAEFYLYRAYQDDIIGPQHAGLKPMTQLDFGLPIIRVAEALAVGLAFAKALGASAEADSSVAFEFRWNKLKDRVLTSWAQPDRVMMTGRRAYRDVVTSIVEVPVDVPQSSLHDFVDSATKPLFEAFDGLRLGQKIIEDFVTRLLTRRL